MLPRPLVEGIFTGLIQNKIFNYSFKYFVGQNWKKTLPEAQRTQGIESITQIITHGKKKHFRGEMKYMSDYKNQAWSLKLK